VCAYFNGAPLVLRAGAVVAAIALTLAALTTLRLLKRNVPAPAKPVTVLIADFDNQTSEAVFDGTIEHAIGLALEDRRFAPGLDVSAPGCGAGRQPH
jgi:hypothetical protein